jgi:hypothetical protein
VPAKKKGGGWGDEYVPPSDKQPMWNARDYVGLLHLFIEPQREVRDSQFGESEVANCAYVIVLEGPDAGKAFGETGVWGNLGRNLNEYEGSSFALGVVNQGKAKPGRSAPFILDDPDDKQKAEAFKWMDDWLVRSPEGIKVKSADDAAF